MNVEDIDNDIETDNENNVEKKSTMNTELKSRDITTYGNLNVEDIDNDIDTDNENNVEENNVEESRSPSTDMRILERSAESVLNPSTNNEISWNILVEKNEIPIEPPDKDEKTLDFLIESGQISVINSLFEPKEERIIEHEINALACDLGQCVYTFTYDLRIHQHRVHDKVLW